MADEVPTEIMAAFAAVVATRFPDVDAEALTFTVHDGDVAVPGFTALSATAGDRTIRGWAKADGTVVIAQRTSLVPILDALGFADEPPPIDDGHLAQLLAWGYGDDYQLLDHVEQGDLGLRTALSCPPLRERRAADGATVLRYVLRKRHLDDTAIMALTIARAIDGTYRFDGWQLAPKDDA